MLGHEESLSEQEILVELFVSFEHHGWVSTSWTLMQVSNAMPPKEKGKSQLSQPVGSGLVGGSVVGDQTTRNPVCVSLPSELNLTSTVLMFVMMVNGVDISPQYFSPCNSTQS